MAVGPPIPGFTESIPGVGVSLTSSTPIMPVTGESIVGAGVSLVQAGPLAPSTNTAGLAFNNPKNSALIAILSGFGG